MIFLKPEWVKLSLEKIFLEKNEANIDLNELLYKIDSKAITAEICKLLKDFGVGKENEKFTAA